MFKRILTAVLLALTVAGLTACHKDENKTPANKIRVGTIAGPETRLVEVAKQVAARDYNLDIQIVQFTDYTMPNEALADHSIDANVFQHLPYLEEAVKAKHYEIMPIGKTFIYPMAIYSRKITELTQLPNGATVAIPNDPSNETRALLLLQKANLIKLNPTAGITATEKDIIENPMNLKITEIDAAQLPRVLPDVDIAVINTNYAMLAGLVPSRDGLFLEGTDSPYANLIVVRTADKDNPNLQNLVKALHSTEVVKKAQELFQGQAIPAWQ